MKKTVLLFILVFFCLMACGETPSPSILYPTASPFVSPTTAAPSPYPDPFVFTEENFPRIDGSTATIPLGQAVTEALLGKTVEPPVFSGTSSAWSSLKWKSSDASDILLVYEPEEGLDEWRDDYDIAPIGKDALVFLVNAQNPLDSLLLEQIQHIYSGEITNWKNVGGTDAEIIAYQRNASSGSQTLMEKLVMQGLPMAKEPVSLVITDMGNLMDVVASYNNSQSAIGYNVYYYVSEMRSNPNVKLLQINGVAPDNGSIQSEIYPFVNDFYAVIRKSEPEDSPARRLFEWLQTPEGQAVAESAGYVPVTPSGEDMRGESGFTLEEMGSRYYPDYTDTLIPSPDYGNIYPFLGGLPYGQHFGLCTEDGQIVVDAVYAKAEYAERDGKKLYMLERYLFDDTEELWNVRPETTFATLDGAKACVYADHAYYHAENIDYEYKLGIGVLVFPKLQYIPVKNEIGWGALDFESNLVYPCRERFPVQFCEGLAAVWDEDGTRYWYVNVQGDRVLGPYDLPYAVNNDRDFYSDYLHQPNVFFSHGLAVFQEGGLYGYIDKTGKIVIDPQYKAAYPFFGEYAVVEDEDNIIVINQYGRVLAETADLDLENVIAVDEKIFMYTTDEWGKRDREYIFIDSAGEIVESAEQPREEEEPDERPEGFSWGVRFGEYFATYKDNYTGLVNADGEWIIKLSMLDY